MTKPEKMITDSTVPLCSIKVKSIFQLIVLRWSFRFTLTALVIASRCSRQLLSAKKKNTLENRCTIPAQWQ